MDKLLTSNWTLAGLLGLASVLAFLAGEPLVGVVAGGLGLAAALHEVRHGLA